MKAIRNEKGSVVIEFALVGPLLMVLLMGIAEFSMVLYTQQLVSHATNIAARSGATSLDDAVSNTRATTSATSTITNSGLDPAKATVTVNIYSNPIPGEVEVITTYQYDLLFSFFTEVLGFPSSYNLRAQQNYRR
jgi:Flp pilus assembly protein TadG